MLDFACGVCSAGELLAILEAFDAAVAEPTHDDVRRKISESASEAAEREESGWKRIRTARAAAASHQHRRASHGNRACGNPRCANVRKNDCVNGVCASCCKQLWQVRLCPAHLTLTTTPGDALALRPRRTKRQRRDRRRRLGVDVP